MNSLDLLFLQRNLSVLISSTRYRELLDTLSVTVLCVCLVAQLCPTLCGRIDCSPPGTSANGDFPGRNTGVGCYALLQEIFPTQGSNSGLLHCRLILYHLSHQGSSRILEWVAYPFSRGIFLTQELNQGFLHCRQIFYRLSYQRILKV